MSQATVSRAHTYKIDEAHATARFWVRHMMIAKVHGELSDVTGTVQYDADQPTVTQVEVHISTASLTTSNEQRDAHLKSPDFLDIEKFPSIDFRSTGVKKVNDEEFDVTGDLTIHG